MPVRIRVDVDDARVRQTLALLGKFRLDRADWSQIGQSLVASTQDRFERGRGPDDVPWKPSRRAAETGGQTLVDTAALRNSIAFRASADGVEVGPAAAVPYAHVHQLGSPRKNIDARPFLGLDDDDFDMIREVVLDALRRSVQQ